jgi:hypothetical protein
VSINASLAPINQKKKEKAKGLQEYSVKQAEFNAVRPHSCRKRKVVCRLCEAVGVRSRMSKRYVITHFKRAHNEYSRKHNVSKWACVQDWKLSRRKGAHEEGIPICINFVMYSIRLDSSVTCCKEYVHHDTHRIHNKMYQAHHSKPDGP